MGYLFNMQETLGLTSGLLVTFAAVPYIRDILLRKTKPERATWFIWSVLLAIAFLAQLSKGAGWSLLLTAGDFTAVFIISILSIKYGVGGTTKFDIGTLIGAGIGLILWYLTKEALIALCITIFIDFLAGMLTITKTYRDPYSETFLTYMMCSFGALLSIFSVGNMDFSLLIFPIWICLINFTIGMTTILGKRKFAFQNNS